MSFFIIPQGWIGPAIAAAAGFFGSIGHSVDIKYKNLAGQRLAEASPPHTIIIDKRPASEWPKAKVQCVIVHEYGHLTGFRDSTNTADPIHSDNSNSIMHAVLAPKPCLRWLRAHGL